MVFSTLQQCAPDDVAAVLMPYLPLPHKSQATPPSDVLYLPATHAEHALLAAPVIGLV